MSILNGRWRGSTLVETLVMMIVAGIVFLTVMEGMNLFGRLQARQTESILASSRQTDGYNRFIALLARADSICSFSSGNLELFFAGDQAELSVCDSLLLYHADGFCDTLMGGVGRLQLLTFDFPPDSVEIGIGRGLRACFAVVSQRRQYRLTIEAIEKNYGYEEDR